MAFEQYQKDLQALKAQFDLLKQDSQIAKQSLDQSERSLTKMIEYINQYEKTVKSKIKKLEWQRNLFALAAGYLALK